MPSSRITLPGLALLMYAPFALLGYGANVDSPRIVETGRMFMATGVYTPSRYPGFPVHEIPSALLAHLGGSLLSNLGTVAMAILGVYAFSRVLEHYQVPNRTVLTVALVANPIYWTTATYTIDYVWSLSLLLVGLALMCRRAYFWSCVVFGLATGSRATSIGFATLLIVYQFLSHKDDRPRLLRSAPIVLLIGAVAHAPTLRRYGLQRLYFGDWSAFDYLAIFVDGNMSFLGPVAALGLVGIVPLLVRARDDVPFPEWRWLPWFCVAVVGAYELLFLIAPLQVGYLLPALPCLLLLLGLGLRRHRYVLTTWVILSVSSALVNVNVVSMVGAVHRVEYGLPALVEWHGPSLSGRTVMVTSGVFVRWGYVLADAAARWRMPTMLESRLQE